MAKNKNNKVVVPINKQEDCRLQKNKVNSRPNKEGITVIKKNNCKRPVENTNSQVKQKQNNVEKVKTIEIVKKKHNDITSELKQAPRQNRPAPHVPSFEDKILRKIENIDKTIIELTELKFLLRKYKYEHDVRNKK